MYSFEAALAEPPLEASLRLGRDDVPIGRGEALVELHKDHSSLDGPGRLRSFDAECGEGWGKGEL